MLYKKLSIITRDFICLVGLLSIAPILFIAAIAIFIEDGAPVFFVQERIGKNKLIFKIFKMRTLKLEAPNIGTHELDQTYKLKSGKLIRKIKLDEFPQLINVLKGEINLVGPRPGLVSQVNLIECREAKRIYDVKPGITGLSQVLGYDMSNPKKLAEIDKIYIEKKSVLINFLILASTFSSYPKQYLTKIVT